MNNVQVVPQLGPSLVPVTALATIVLGRATLLLSGEGSHLKIYDTTSSICLCAFRVFPRQCIHGVASAGSTSSTTSECRSILVWGSSSVVVLSVAHDTASSAVLVQASSNVFNLEDWILDVVFSSQRSAQLLALTAYNELYLIDSQHAPKESGVELETSAIRLLSRGPSVALLSAHIILEPHRVLVGCGTVFGEVLVWEYELDGSDVLHQSCVDGLVLHSFRGHEGSVFGVCMSEPFKNPSSLQATRLIASCSDDRTIRVSVLNDNTIIGRSKDYGGATSTGFISTSPLAAPSGQSIKPALTASAHLSRIWDVRFLPRSAGEQDTLLSFGEDAVVQIWELRKKIKGNEVSNLVPTRTLDCHEGKSIWSSTMILGTDGCISLWTGGADGAIIEHRLSNSGRGLSSIHWKSSTAELKPPTGLAKHLHTKEFVGSEARERDIFLAMRGRWKLSRSIKSRSPTYPSGTFDGVATLTLREASDPAYDLEMLYREEGDFETSLGYSFKASRMYVYRYCVKSRSISAWFVSVADGTSVDYLFHRIDHLAEVPSRSLLNSSTHLVGSGYHLCVQDHYNATYDFNLSSGILETWNLKYMVNGPHKDYTATATFTREENINDVPNQEPVHVDRPKKQGSHDAFKSYCWSGKNELLATTDNGKILYRTFPLAWKAERQNHQIDAGWYIAAKFKDLESYSTILRLEGLGAVVSGSSGNIYLFSTETKAVRQISQVPRKVAGMFGERLHVDSIHGKMVFAFIVSCQGSGLAHYLGLSHMATDDQQINSMTLALPKNWVTTSAAFLSIEDQRYAILGSRTGDLCVYHIAATVGDEAINPKFYARHTNGADTITAIRVLPSSLRHSDEVLLATTGRDGYYRVQSMKLSIGAEPLVANFETVHEMKPPLGPNIEGIHLDIERNELSLSGFRGKHFVLWNATTVQELITIECGNAHRAYAFTPGEQLGGSLAWTQASACNVYLQSDGGHKIAKFGGHGREIKAIAISHTGLIATGAEDTNIRVFKMSGLGANRGFRCLQVLSGHNTGIQQLRWSSNGRHLFSIAGLEELYVWKLSPMAGFIELAAYRIAQAPAATEEHDLRIMDFVVQEKDTHFILSTVYSDSSIRIWHIDLRMPTPSFSLLRTGVYGSHCLLQIHELMVRGCRFLLTTGTDGYLALWLDEKSKLGERVSNSGLEQDVVSTQRHKCHHNSIKSLLVKTVSQTDAIAFTGGDDNSLVLTRISAAAAEHEVEFTSLAIPKAHSSAINAMEAFERVGSNEMSRLFLIVSMSTDQRLKTWSLRIELSKPGVQGFFVEKGGDIYSAIADASCMAIYPRQDDSDEGTANSVIVAGIGLELYTIPV